MIPIWSMKFKTKLELRLGQALIILQGIVVLLQLFAVFIIIYINNVPESKNDFVWKILNWMFI